MSEIPESYVAVAGNPPPAETTFGSFEIAADKALRFALARPVEGKPARGTILLLQGRNEATEKYFETMRDLVDLGFAVATFDWRGQGRSFRATRWTAVGHVGRMEEFAGDLVRFVEEVLPRCPAPYGLVGHSMGGLVALHAAGRLEGRIERMVLLAPLIGLPGGRGRRRVFAAVSSLLHLMGLGGLPIRRARRFSRSSSLADNRLTSDPVRFERNRRLQETAPDLFVGALSASWLRAMLKAQSRLDRSDVIAALRIPTLIIGAGDDRVVSTAAAERLAWRMRSGHFLRVPGARHELLQEADRYRAPVLAAVEAFFGSALPATPPTEPAVDAALVEEALVAALPDVVDSAADVSR